MKNASEGEKIHLIKKTAQLEFQNKSTVLHFTSSSIISSSSSDRN